MVKILFGSLDPNVGKMFLPLERRLTPERLRSRNKLSLSFSNSWSGTASESSSLLRNNWFQKLKNVGTITEHEVLYYSVQYLDLGTVRNRGVA